MDMPPVVRPFIIHCYPLVDVWIVLSFLVLRENTVDIHICLCGDNFTILFHTYLGVELRGHVVKKVLVAQVVSDS